MNQRIKLSKGIQYLWAVLALIVFLLIWPFDIIESGHTSKSDEVILQESDPITVEHNGTQMFIAEGNHLKAVELYVANDMAGETITFRVYDGAYIQLWETFYVVDEGAKFPGFIRIPIEMEMEEGWEYYYTVEGLTKELILYYEDLNASTSYANGTLLYGGQEMPGINLIARYQYSAPFSWWMTLIFGIVLAVLAAVLIWLTDKLFVGKLSRYDREITVQRFLQWIGNPLIAVITLIALLAVFPGRVFGVGVVNYAFYYLGILVTAGVLFFGLNYKRKGSMPLITVSRIKSSWPRWAMSICFAGALWSCYEYMNGLYDIHHSYAACRMLTWFALAIICTFKKNELFTVYHLIYAIAAPIGGYFYAKPYEGVAEQDELYKLQAYVLVVGGFALLSMIIALIKMMGKKKLPSTKLYLPYTGCLALLLGLMIMFRNTRTWVVLLAVLFILFYLRMWMWEKKDRLLPIFGNALILHFVYTVGYCLLHRPYLRFKFHRYGMTYHTVTMTGYYLALILCAVVVRLFVVYRKTKRWQDTWKELSLLGIGNVYLFLTLSRTGYLAAFVMELFVIIFTGWIWEKEKLKSALRTLGLTAAVSVVLFPAVFTMQRILPAVYNDPVYSEIEVWEYTTRKGTPADSELYIDIIAFVKVMNNKLFGMDTGNISLSSAFDRLQPVYLRSEGMLLASADPGVEEESDFSNGRIDIFREYIGHWNATGHELMGVPLQDGTMAVHAHNTFLQVAHDHGVITGMVFLLFGIFTFVFSAYRYGKEKEKQPWLLLIAAISLAFAAAGMVEWIYHICNPFGFSIMVVIAPLLFKPEKKLSVNGDGNE